MRKSYQILILCFVIIITLLLYTYSETRSGHDVSHLAWNKYEDSFIKQKHISIMLNKMQHLTRLYLATTVTDDAFELDNLIITASKARSIYIQHYLEMEKLTLDAIEQEHMDKINQQAGKIRLAQLDYDKQILGGIPVKERLELAMAKIISPQNNTQNLMEEFLDYIRDKNISDSEQYKAQEDHEVRNIELLQLTTLFLTVFLSIFSVYIVFKGQKTIHDKNHALSQTQSFLHSTINSTPIAIIITDKSGQIVMSNNRAESLFQYTREQLLAMSISDLIPENLRSQHEQHLLDYAKQPVSREMYTGLEITALRGSGELFPVEVGLSPIDGQDELTIACSIKDITEQKALEKELLDSKNQAEQANEIKSEFLASVSHELRTPLHAILSFSRLGLKNVLELPVQSNEIQKLQSYFNKIQLSGAKLLNFINDLLDSAKFESGKMELKLSQYNIIQTVQSVKNEQEARLQELQLHLSINAPQTDLMVQCDQERMNQLITNLISNAVKYSPEKGNIEITISPDIIQTDADTAQEAIRFSIQDEGTGIPVEQLENIFQKFIQSSNAITGGTGLGLSLCKDIIDAHGGKIWAENRQPHGSIFTFIIPVEQPI